MKLLDSAGEAIYLSVGCLRCRRHSTVSRSRKDGGWSHLAGVLYLQARFNLTLHSLPLSFGTQLELQDMDTLAAFSALIETHSDQQEAVQTVWNGSEVPGCCLKSQFKFKFNSATPAIQQEQEEIHHVHTANTQACKDKSVTMAESE